MMIIIRFFVPLFMVLFVAIHILIGVESAKSVKTTKAPSNNIAIFPKQNKIATSSYPKTTADLIKLLGPKSEWFTYRDTPIIKRLPADFAKLSPDYRKRVFVAAILPIANAVKKQFDAEHRYVIRIKNKISQNIAISRSEKERLNSMFSRYKIVGNSLRQKIQKLLVRTGSVPISLILAQAAIESDWGASRFAIKGNNLFGIRTYKAKGMKPKNYSGDGKRFRVVVYKDLEASIKNYIINFNIGWAYKGLRKARNAIYPNENPYIFADKLIYYSTRRNDYIRAIKNVIVRNNFERFDKNNPT